MSGLEVAGLSKSFGALPVLSSLDLAIPAGAFTAIVGESGSGKTTLLRLLAGFERPDAGRIEIGGQIVSDPHVHVRPDRRRIGYVPQEGNLFPHLTVEANVGFGVERAVRRARVAEMLELVELAELGRRYPHQLSGGQQQRVALARALAVEPAVVLLDEPFASLDAHLREGVREDVRRILRTAGATAVLVTHDQDEALSFADYVAVLRDGRIAQFAPPQTGYGAPVDPGVAGFIGTANLLEGASDASFAETPVGRLPAVWAGEPPRAPVAVTVLVRPEQVRVSPAGHGEGLPGRVVAAGYHGHESVVQVELEGPAGVLVARTGSDVAVGAAVTVTVEGPVVVWAHTATPTA